jgi:hypothetical protein
MTELPRTVERRLRGVTVGVVVLAAVWSLVPVGIWWAQWPAAYFAQAWQLWLWGGLVSLLLAALALLVSRGRVAVVAARAWAWLMAVPRGRFVAVAAVTIGVLTLLATLLLFDRNPRNVDGFAELFQARIFLAGRLWARPAPEIANFAVLQMVLGPQRWYSQYPPGESLVLAAGLAMGAWWLLHPLIAAGLLVATARVGRWLLGEAESRLAVVLLCLSPFVVVVAGSEMSHLPSAALGMAAAAAATATGGPRRQLAAVMAGLALGAQAAFRPLDATAAAVPIVLITILASPRPLGALALMGAAGAVASLPTLWYNHATTGGWLTFGYIVLWGPQHSLGFHEVPFGTALTLTRAVALTGIDLHRLNTYLFDVPVPVLAVAAAGFVLGRRRLTARDAVPALGAVALFGLLFFYWHRDVFYGPRLHYAAMPWVVLLVARGARLLSGSAPRAAPRWGPLIGTVLAIVFVFGLVSLAPARLEAYRAAWPMFRLHPDRDAERAGIRHAVVVIPDGWGSRLIARMWASGIPAARSTRLYAAIDACTLEQALDEAAVDRSGEVHGRLLGRLDSIAARGRPGERTGVTQDSNLRLPAGSALPPVCSAELALDAPGFLVFAPFLYLNRPSLDGDIVWARDLGPWNAALFARYADRPLYRYAPLRRGGPPAFTPLQRPPVADGVR